MNYAFNPLIHLLYFQSYLIEYYDLLCVHVLICIWLRSPDLADWPWSALEAEKKLQTQKDSSTQTHAYMSIKI